MNGGETGNDPEGVDDDIVCYFCRFEVFRAISMQGFHHAQLVQKWRRYDGPRVTDENFAMGKAFGKSFKGQVHFEPVGFDQVWKSCFGRRLYTAGNLGGSTGTGWDITPRIGTGFLNLANSHFE